MSSSPVYLIYGITDCPACLRACADLMERDIEYVFIETDFAPSYRERIKKQFEWKTMPLIVKLFRDEETLVGGYDDLVHLLTYKSKSPT